MPPPLPTVVETDLPKNGPSEMRRVAALHWRLLNRQAITPDDYRRSVEFAFGTHRGNSASQFMRYKPNTVTPSIFQRRIAAAEPD